MARARIKKGDTVVVITGTQKGRSGRVLHVDKDKSRVLVEGVNLRKKTVRRSQDQPQGGIVEVGCPLHLSNVMLEETYKAKHGDEAVPATQDTVAQEEADSETEVVTDDQ